MDIIGYDCLKQILKLCDHGDLIRWTIVSKTFYKIINSLTFDIDFYTACATSKYLVIKKLNNNNYTDWNKALKESCKSGKLNVFKFIYNNGIFKIKIPNTNIMLL